MDKSRLRQVIIAQLQTDFDLLTRAALMARAEATDEESKAENKYDTRGQEAAYLAEGQAKLATELQSSIALFHVLPLPDFSPAHPVDIGAIVQLTAGKNTSWYVLTPRNGGLAITLDATPLTLVTTQSPLGRQLFAKKLGDIVHLPSRTGPQPHSITAIL